MKTSEHYLKAVGSADMKMSARERTDTDVLAAAGLQRLFAVNSVGMELVAAIERAKSDYDQRAAVSAAVIERAVLLMVRKVNHFEAAFGCLLEPQRRRELAEAVLVGLLEPRCGKCLGTAAVGPYGTIRRPCPRCKATGEEPLRLNGCSAGELEVISALRSFIAVNSDVALKGIRRRAF